MVRDDASRRLHDRRRIALALAPTIIEFAKRFGVPQRIDADVAELSWLFAYSSVAVATVAVLAYWINVSFSQSGNASVNGVGLAAQCVTFALLAEGLGANAGAARQ
jgi:hypothetical protein